MAARLCKIRIQIGTGTVEEAITKWGLYLIKSDDTIIPPMKDYPTREYPESSAVEIHPYASLQSFDYTCTLLCLGALSTVNQTVRNFYDSLFTITTGKDLRQALPITLYNDYKGIKLTGYAKTAEGKEYYPKLSKAEEGAYTFDLTLFVADPKTLISL